MLRTFNCYLQINRPNTVLGETNESQAKEEACSTSPIVRSSEVTDRPPALKINTSSEAFCPKSPSVAYDQSSERRCTCKGKLKNTLACILAGFVASDL